MQMSDKKIKLKEKLSKAKKEYYELYYSMAECALELAKAEKENNDCELLNEEMNSIIDYSDVVCRKIIDLEEKYNKAF